MHEYVKDTNTDIPPLLERTIVSLGPLKSSCCHTRRPYIPPPPERILTSSFTWVSSKTRPRGRNRARLGSRLGGKETKIRTRCWGRWSREWRRFGESCRWRRSRGRCTRSGRPCTRSTPSLNPWRLPTTEDISREHAPRLLGRRRKRNDGSGWRTCDWTGMCRSKKKRRAGIERSNESDQINKRDKSNERDRSNER